MGLSLEEQETHINWDRLGETASVITTDRTVMTKLDKMCEAHPDNYECIHVNRLQDDHSVVEKEYVIADKGLISFRGARVTRELTDEQKKEMADRLKAHRMAKFAE